MGGQGGCEPGIVVIVKMKKKVRGGQVGQGGCEPRIEVVVKMKQKSRGRGGGRVRSGGGGSGWM